MNQMKIRGNSKQTKGFSFIEILIVLAIVAGIATLVLQQSDTAIDSSYVHRLAQILEDVQVGAQRYRVSENTYRDMDLETLVQLGTLPDEWNTRSQGGAGGALEDGTNITVSQVTSDPGRYVVFMDLNNSDALQIANQLSSSIGGTVGNCHAPTLVTGGSVDTITCGSLGGAWGSADQIGTSIVRWGYIFD